MKAICLISAKKIKFQFDVRMTDSMISVETGYRFKQRQTVVIKNQGKRAVNLNQFFYFQFKSRQFDRDLVFEERMSRIGKIVNLKLVNKLNFFLIFQTLFYNR